MADQRVGWLIRERVTNQREGWLIRERVAKYRKTYTRDVWLSFREMGG